MNRQQAQRRGLLDYYELLVEKEPTPWNPGYHPRSSDVTPEECWGAGTLLSVMDEFQPETQLEHRHDYTAPTFVPAMGHKFGRTTLCVNCGCSWEFHQQDKTRCYVESGDAPKEDAAIVRERIRKLEEIYKPSLKMGVKRTGKYPSQCIFCGDSFGTDRKWVGSKEPRYCSTLCNSRAARARREARMGI